MAETRKSYLRHRPKKRKDSVNELTDKVGGRRNLKKRVPNLTSEADIIFAKQEKKKRNAKNKTRAKQMENEIAKMLRGSRIPMSGAMKSYKGDVEIPFEHFPGKYIIECKLSDQHAAISGNDRKIRLDMKWFPKLQEEVIKMRAKFGVLITHYVHTRYEEDYVFIRREDLQKIVDTLSVPEPYNELIKIILSERSGCFVIDVRYKSNGLPRSGFDVLQGPFEQKLNFAQGFLMPHLLIKIIHGDYFVLKLKDFRAILAHT